ncbi:MAG: ImmA/IrrE family metallo-endopeptidase [Oscillospiraceae bacterium]|nr:ImmA/IrrE family metallo-endopeptidase [Oscillospiraceae bacterium]
MNEEESRDRRVFAAVNALVERYVSCPPVDVLTLCRRCGAGLLSFQQAEAAGLDREALLGCLGNRDGVALEASGRWVIVYDGSAPVNRLRFTLAEELLHHALGHTRDPDFVWHEQRWSEEKYRRYEAEAKRGACLLLVPPSVYGQLRSWYRPAQLARLFGVSEACLARAAAWYEHDGERVRALFTAKNLTPHGLTRGLPLGKPVRPVEVQGNEE